MSVKSVKSKIKNLRSYFSKEQQKMSVVKSGAGADEKYETSWFAYKHMLFIGDSITLRSTKESLTEDTVISEEIEGGKEIIQDNIADDDQLPEIEAPQTQAAATSSCTQRKFLPQPQTCRGMKRKIEDDRKREDQAFSFLEVAAQSLTNKDDCSIFGEMIATQLRKLTSRNQAIARNRIQNVIFELEIQEMNISSQKNTPASQYYSPSSDSSYSAHYEPTTNTQPQSSGLNTPQPGNVFGEVQQYLCFNLDNNNIEK